jgi:hypothetical protein
MKITDDELLHAIWLNQLKNLSSGVLCNYIGGGVGLWRNFEFASDQHIRWREEVTDRLSKQQLLKRIRKLAECGKITSPYGKRLLTFYIESPAAREAYEAANQWWRERGVPEGYGKHPDGRDYAKTVKLDNLDALKAECAQYLLANWSDAL